MRARSPNDKNIQLLTLLVAQRYHFPFAFTDLDAVDRLDCEIFAGEREGFFFHVESHWLRIAL